MRRCALRLQVAGKGKMETLHKLLVGEAVFKNGALLKESNVEHQFGAEWKKDFAAYTAKLPAEQKTVVDRQVARLSLTRYTTRELAQFAGNGAENVDAVSQKWMLTEGKTLLKEKGEAAFVEHVKAEAKLANWSDAAAAKFIDAVKAAK